jgi:hypothetical protein
MACNQTNGNVACQDRVTSAKFKGCKYNDESTWNLAANCSEVDVYCGDKSTYVTDKVPCDKRIVTSGKLCIMKEGGNIKAGCEEFSP